MHMDMIPLIVATLWIVGMVLEHAKFANLWSAFNYHPRALGTLFTSPSGKERLRDFPFLGRILFSAGIIILAYGMDTSVLLSGVLFILILGIVHNLCACTRSRFPYPTKPLSLTIRLIVALASVLEIITYFSLITVFFAPYVLLSVVALRFLFTSLSVLILSPFLKNLS